jgi:hypothetical protein
MDTHLGTWNVGLNENNRTRIRINSVCDTGGAKSAVQYAVLTGTGNGTYQQRAGFFIHKRIILTVEVAELNDSDKMSQIVLGGCWCDVTVVNTHVPSDDKSHDKKVSFYDAL